jgi:large subunit ribosomal protein L6
MKEDIEEIVEFPSDVVVSVDGFVLSVKGPEGEVKREFKDSSINIKKEDGKVVFSAKNASRREKKMLMTYVAHFNNLVKGVKEKFNYVLKICSSHFPMNVSLSGNKLTIKNFLGEKFPRVLTIKKNVEVKINGDLINVSSCCKEDAGMVASDIELLTRKSGKDLRIFQDGIYIVDKGGKKI